MCSGKVYYDLFEIRQHENIQHIALLRIEQLYPFPEKILKKLLASYHSLEALIWCQEEPRNQGAWDSTKHRYRHYEDRYQVSCVSRPAAAAPAVGSMKIHKKRQAELVKTALGLLRPPDKSASIKAKEVTLTATTTSATKNPTNKGKST